MLIEKYTSNWTNYFADLKREIENELNGLEYSIEHVGSTSVQNLDSKPIIDIDIIYDNETEFKKIKSGLIKLGYYHNGNQGIEKREVFKRDGISLNNILDSIAHHLYVCPIDSEALERHILMRNFLRKNDWARIKYQTMKYELAEKANQNKKVYAELKELNINEFIDEIIKKEKTNAQQWL
ncbi:GrpB family protein [Lutimonas vermicola]|uniref:GrpB family protein n=1 Tax=Lutimonas vermicola TaxID=414288 RepID=A0ABU9L272_9FLAO